jgi:hypothetical protein
MLFFLGKGKDPDHVGKFLKICVRFDFLKIEICFSFFRILEKILILGNSCACFCDQCFENNFGGQRKEDISFRLIGSVIVLLHVRKSEEKKNSYQKAHLHFSVFLVII